MGAGLPSTCSLFALRRGIVGNGFRASAKFPPRQKPGSFNLDQVMEAVTKPHSGGIDVAPLMR